MSRGDGWIAVDLDGTLAYYDGWKGAEHIGDPVPEMLGRVKRWLREGKTVKIFTARVAPTNEDRNESRIAIRRWCKEHLGTALEVTATKDFGMITLWDDRAVQVEKNTGRRIG